MPGVKSKREQKEVLTAFRRALSQERHNLLGRPEILWQQMYNRLQWADGEDTDGPVADVISPEFEKRTAMGARPWMHNRCRTRESEALIAVLIGHTKEVNSCVFSPDGKMLASTSRYSTVRLWNLNTGSEWAVLENHHGEVNSCAFSPDGKTLGSAGEDKKIRIWDAATGKLLHIFPCIGSVCTCNFSPSGKMIAAGDKGGNVYLLDMYGFEFRPFGIDSEADSLTEQDPERFPSKNKNQKEQEEVQRSSDDLICPYCKSRNPAGSKWCMIDGSRL